MTFDPAPLWLSLKTAALATGLTFVLGTLCARWRLGRSGRWGEVLDTVLMLPIALPPSVVGLGLLLTFGMSSPVGRLLAEIGAPVIFSWPAAVLASFVVSFPIMYQTARGAFGQIDASLLDAARLFSPSEWRILWRVMIPLAGPGLAAGAVLSFLRALGEFGATLMIAGNIPGRTQTAPVAIFFAIEAGERNEALALAGVMVAISLGAIALLRRFGESPR